MKGERGSILPLGIGLVSISLVIGLIFVELGAIGIQQVRNKQVSDLLALEVSGQLLGDGIPAVAGLDYTPSVQGQLAEVIKLMKVAPSYVSVVSFDGKTLEAKFCTHWRSVTGIRFGRFGDVCSSSKARVI